MNHLRQVAMMFAEAILFVGILGMTYFMVGSLMISLNIAEVTDFNGTSLVDPYNTLLVDYLPVFIGSLVGVLAVHQVIFKRKINFSGFKIHGIIKQFGLGFFYSLALLTIGFGLLYALGYLEIQALKMDVYLFFGFLLFFFIQSSFEEIAIRSFLLPTIAHRSNIWIGIVASSIIFMLMHVGNANITFISLLNIFLAGVLLGILYIRYGQIWAPIGLHVGWNFLQGSFFGFEVSGVNVYSYIDSDETGPDLLTGGAFGFEGSLLASVFLIALSFWIWKKAPEKFTAPYHPKLIEVT